MSRSRPVGLVVLTLVASGVLAGCDGEDAPVRGNLVGPRGPAELILGTWTLTELDGGRMPWYASYRMEYRPDGTCVESNNKNLLRIRIQRGIAQYRVEGNTIHKAAEVPADSPRRSEPGFVQPDGLHHWEATIAELTDTRLTEVYVSKWGREAWTYRRVR